MAEGAIRIDKWLWHARFFKTRTLAQNFVVAGKVRVNTVRVEKANHSVKPGDVLTFVRGHHVRVIKVIGLAARRGPASEAQRLYEDLSPPPPSAKDDPDVPVPTAKREPGAGRPTKRERRDLDKLRGE